MPLAMQARPRQKTPRLRRIERTLDSLEKRFLRAVRKLLAERVRDLQPAVEQAVATGRMDNVSLPRPGAYAGLVETLAIEGYGAGLGNGVAEVEDLRKRKPRTVQLKVDGQPVVPEDALLFLQKRRDLARFFEAAQAEKVRTVLAQGLQEGHTVEQVMKNLQRELPGTLGKARAENIARTEATTAYNQGRLAAFLQAREFITGVQFMAILDARVTDICQHRDGLYFKLDDPVLRQNTPPLHYQCRSVLSPVSRWELDDAELERSAKKMEGAPAPQVTPRGVFGSEPWPDVQGGAAPAPRAKPVGPKVPAGESVPAAAQKQHPKVDLLPVPQASGRPPGTVAPGKTWLPKEKEHVQHPSGLRVYDHPSAGQGNGVAGQVLKVIGGLPQGVRDTLQKGGVRAWFMDEASFLSLGRRPGGMRLKRWQRKLRDIVEHEAVTLTDFPRMGEVTMIFITDRLAMQEEERIAHAARHETGHALHRSITRKGPRKQRRALRDALREAFDKRSSLLPKSFHTSPTEFLAEGADWYHKNKRTRGLLKLLAPRLHAILDPKDEVLSLMELDIRALEEDGITVLYYGAEGFAATGGGDDEITFSLNLGNGQEGETLRPDGTILTHGGGSKKIGHIRATWPTLKVWTPEEAEPYKAFLRSKGVTLPHVMS